MSNQWYQIVSLVLDDDDDTMQETPEMMNTLKQMNPSFHSAKTTSIEAWRPMRIVVSLEYHSPSLALLYISVILLFLLLLLRLFVLRLLTRCLLIVEHINYITNDWYSVKDPGSTLLHTLCDDFHCILAYFVYSSIISLWSPFIDDCVVTLLQTTPSC